MLVSHGMFDRIDVLCMSGFQEICMCIYGMYTTPEIVRSTLNYYIIGLRAVNPACLQNIRFVEHIQTCYVECEYFSLQDSK